VWGFDDLTLAASEGGPSDGGTGTLDAPSNPDVTSPMDDGGPPEAGPDAVASCPDGVLNDRLNCGGCGNVCDNLQSLGASCVQSDGGPWECAYTGCASGLEDCDTSNGDLNGCETSMTSTGSCGACGTVCDQTHSVGASCAVGSNGMPVCTYQGCQPGFADCDMSAADTDGCETALDTATDCGMCGRACDSSHSDGASCPDGKTCQYTGCHTGYADCMSDAPDTDGCEMMVAANTCTACGSCDTTNSNYSGSCGSNGACLYSSCKPGFKDCNTTPPDTNGCETATNTTSNCGDCGVACDTTHSQGAACSASSCTYTGCLPGYLDCDSAQGTNADGCESAATSIASCGACKVACNTTTGTASCNGSTCAYKCSTGLSDCNAAKAPDTDGCECKTPGCCGSGCQTVHKNGVGAAFYDCSAQSTFTSASATEACEASAGSGHCTSSSKCCGLLGTCLLASTAQSICGVVNGACYCWQYAGSYPGSVQAEPASACTASCGAGSDPSWN
jgi:hypothetical protein